MAARIVILVKPMANKGVNKMVVFSLWSIREFCRRNLLLVLMVLILSSCGIAGCLLKEDAQTDKHEVKVCTNPKQVSDGPQCEKCDCYNDYNCADCQKCIKCTKPEKFDPDDPKTHWVKSTIEIKNERSVAVRIIPGDTVDICHGGCPENCEGSNCDTEFCKVAKVGVKNTSANPVYKDMKFKVGDSISFSMYPYLSGKIDKDICDGKNPDVYADDPTTCTNNNIGKYYRSIIGDPVDRNNNPKDDPSVNVALDTRQQYNWISGAVLYSSVSGEVLQQYITEYGDIVSLCNELKNRPNSDDSKDIKKKVDAFTLNITCRNLRMYEYNVDPNSGSGTQGNLIQPTGNFTAITYQESDGQISYYLPLFKATLIGDNNGHFFEIKQDRIAEENCTQLNKAFTINDGGTLVFAGNIGNSFSKVQLTIEGNDQAHDHCGYTIKVSRKCKADTEKILYAYVGNGPPDFKPGEGDSIMVQNIVIPSDQVDPQGANIFEIPGEKSGSVYFGIKDIQNDGYAGNIGYFTVEARTEKQAPPILSTAIKAVRNQILMILYGHNVVNEDGTVNEIIAGHEVEGAVGSVYVGILDSTFRDVIRALIFLYIIVYSILFLIGGIKSPQSEFIIILLKIGIVAVLLGDGSWRFFNEYLFSLFINGSTELINIMSGPIVELDTGDGKVGKAEDFYFLDRLLGKFAIGQTWLQIFSLLFAGPVGWLLMLGILWGIWELLCAIFNAVINYFMSIIIVAILICLAPLFICLVFFKRTKSIFDSWIKNLAQVATLPSIIFAALALISNAMDGILYTLFNYDICSQCVIEPVISPGVLGVGEITLCLLEVLVPLGYFHSGSVQDQISSTYDGVGFMGIAINVPALIAFIVLAHALSAFVQHGASIAMNIFGSFGANLNQGAEKFNDSMRAIFGRDISTQTQRMRDKHAKELRPRKERPHSVKGD